MRRVTLGFVVDVPVSDSDDDAIKKAAIWLSRLIAERGIEQLMKDSEGCWPPCSMDNVVHSTVPR